MSNTISNKVRVRYAPSPTGFLHIGNAQSALFNYLFAKHFDGTMVLRIEDTDVKRNVKNGEKSQMDYLHWLNIDWDEGPDKPNVEYAPYHQTERLSIYKKYVQELLKSGKAYKDFTTEEELTKMRDEQRARKEPPHYDGRWYGASAEKIAEAEKKGIPYAIRLHLPENHIFRWNDIVKGLVEFNSDNIGGDFIIQKSNGYPTYNFAVVVDDHLMDITDVIRGDDHIANTPKQIAVYEAFGWKQPNFGHISLIYNPKTGKKLSKRDKETLQFISEYKRNGYLSEAIFNFIAFLGWSPKGEKEIYTREQLIKEYDPKRMSKSPAFFDQNKLDWLNEQYIKDFSTDTLVKRTIALINDGETDIAKKLKDANIDNLSKYMAKIIDIYRHNVVKLTDFMKYAYYYNNILNEDIDYSQLKPFVSDNLIEFLNEFKKEISNSATDSEYSTIITELGKKFNRKGKELYFPLNVMFTGSSSAPQVPDIMALMPKKVLIKLIDNAINYMNTL